MGLELYAQIEEHLDFQKEVNALHRTFLELIKQIKAQNVLDIGCGQGGFLELLAQNAISNFGIDLSEGQIQIAKSKGLNVATTPLKNISQNFDCASAIFDVVNYIEPSQIGDFFEEVYNILLDNGYFIFDINTKFAFEEIVEGCIVIEKEELFISIDANFEANVLKTVLNLFSKQADNTYSRQNDTITQYFHAKDFLIKEAKKVGFSLQKSINYHLHSTSQADKMIYILKK